MLTRQDRVKLLDFGLAKSRAPAASDADTRAVLTTEAGVVMGTTGYMSPEQVRGEALDARSDIFSLGIMLHEMLAGARPFEGASAADVMSAVLRADPPPLPDAVPVALRSIVQRCLNRQPSERFQSASDLAFALRSITGSTASRPAVPGDAADRSRRAWAPLRIVAAVVITAAATAGLAAFLMSRALDEPAGAGSVQLLPLATEAHGEAQPVWSPDGRNLAYMAAIDGGQRLYVKAVSTPGAVEVLRCSALCDPVGWSADGARIFFNSRTTHLDARLWSVARSGGGPATFFKDDVQVLAAAFSPNGARLAILRVIRSPDGAGSRYGLFFSEPPGADPVRFDAFALENLVTPVRLAWAADSARLLVFSSVGPRIDVVSLADRSVRPLPVGSRVDLSWGRDPRFAVAARSTLTATRSGLEWLDTETGRFSSLVTSESVLTHPSVSPDGTRVAYTVGELDYDLMEIPLDGSAIRPLLGSRLPEHSVHYSPRTNEFAYVAAGQSPEIRIRQPATMAERIVVSSADFAAQAGQRRFAAVAFSPDGTKLAYNFNFMIWISPSNGGAPAKLTSKVGEFGAEWSPDGTWIAFNFAQPSLGGLVKVRVGAGEPEVRLRPGVCGSAPAWSPDGVWIACGVAPMGLDLVPANGGPPRFLGKQYESAAAWSRDPARLYVIRAQDGRRELGELTWKSGVFRPISTIPADFEFNNAMSWTGRLNLSHDGTSLVTAITRPTGDIWILDGLRPPVPWWKRLLGRR